MTGQANARLTISEDSHPATSQTAVPSSQPVLQVDALNKSFGQQQVLRNISLRIMPGEIIGLVGPNGAGKTTLMETLQGLHSFHSGNISLLGEEVLQHGLSMQVKQRLGVAPQFFSLPSLLRVEEIISLYQVLYRDAIPVNDLLAAVALESQRKMRFSRLSGGQKRRLALALAMAGKPRLMLLDEPTGDLDPQSRRYIWRHIIDSARQSDMGVLIATHQMDEAEALCDRVMIINHGQLLENASPQDLIDRYCPGHHICFSVPEAQAPHYLQALPGTSQHRDEQHHDWTRLSVPARELEPAFTQVMTLSQQLGCEPTQLQVSKNTLEDVFITLTGEALRD